jgi:hypothetical protein
VKHFGLCLSLLVATCGEDPPRFLGPLRRRVARDRGRHVALIDLTDTGAGACDSGAIAFAEGTSRVNDVFVARAKVDSVRKLSFDVGVPQALMKTVIAATSEEGAPSPLREMYWSGASGYRHLVMNATVETPSGTGEGYVHVGSRDCGGAGQEALSDRAN